MFYRTVASNMTSCGHLKKNIKTMAMLVGAKDHAGWGDHLCMDGLRLQTLKSALLTPKRRTGPIQQDRYPIWM
jgi:hypothetical protein